MSKLKTYYVIRDFEPLLVVKARKIDDTEITMELELDEGIVQSMKDIQSEATFHEYASFYKPYWHETKEEALNCLEKYRVIRLEQLKHDFEFLTKLNFEEINNDIR